jgi:hypothetical protein
MPGLVVRGEEVDRDADRHGAADDRQDRPRS